MIPAAFAPLASHLWQSTVFAAVAGLLTLALRRNQARVRCWLWLAASYKFLLPFSWLVSLGHQFEWHTAPAIVPTVLSFVTGVVGGPVFLTVFPGPKTAPDHLHALVFVIWAVWACGFVVIAAGWVREWLRIRAIMRAASPLQLDLPIRVMSTAARLEPGVFGVFRPVLLLPAGIIERLTRPQLKAVLAHELCHVRRRDNLTAAIHMIVEAIFWFHPLVWWIGARLVAERELACDEDVLRLGGEPRVYAESILNVCKFYAESPLTCVSGVTGSDLKKRIQRIMKSHFGAALSAQQKLLLATTGVVALAVPIVAGVLMAPRLLAQSAGVPAWQAAAGGKMSFDVASIKENKSSDRPYSNVKLDNGDAFVPNGGLLRATNWTLVGFIIFAYKVNANDYQGLMSQLPKWADVGRFDLEARASGNPTKDQMRLMMQSLLADRFKLAIHAETRQLPVFGVVPEKPGKMGPQFRQHQEDPPCTNATPTPDSRPAMVAGGFPAVCGVLVGERVSGHQHLSGRNMAMEMIATDLGLIAQVGRPVLDRTGLHGTFDFSIDFIPDLNGGQSPDTNVQPNASGPTFLEALQEQLGLKLVPQTGPVDVLVIDHVEQPSPN